MQDKHKQEKYWDAAAKDPDVRYKYIADEWAETKLFIDLIEKFEPDFTRTCEIGSGIGRLLYELARKHPKDQFFCVDISANMIAMAQQAENIEYLHDPSDLPWRLTTVYSMLVFQHITHEQKRDYIEAAHDALLPGGKLIVQFVVGDENAPYSYQTSIDEMVGMFAMAEFTSTNTEYPVIHDQWAVIVGVK